MADVAPTVVLMRTIKSKKNTILKSVYDFHLQQPLTVVFGDIKANLIFPKFLFGFTSSLYRP